MPEQPLDQAGPMPPVGEATIASRVFEAARNGDLDTLAALLDEHPDMLSARTTPYGWTLLHLAARHRSAVEMLLGRGLIPDLRDVGDNTSPMHWAAAAGELEVVRLLADAGGDVHGLGDHHDLGVIGWATCWNGCDDAAHRAVAEFLVSRGACHHIFSAIAMDRADEVREIVMRDPSALHRRQSRFESNRVPLQFAVVLDRQAMVALLLELGADPLAVDGWGQPVAAYVTAPHTDRPVMRQILATILAELGAAESTNDTPRIAPLHLLAALSLDDWGTAERILLADAECIAPSGGALHLMAKRNDVTAMKWLLDHGAEPNGRWMHWDATVTPLHMAAFQGHEDAVRLLLAAGSDPGIRDGQHDGDALSWAAHFERHNVVQILRERVGKK